MRPDMIKSPSFSYNPLLTSLPAFALKKDQELEKHLKSKGLDVFDFTRGDPKEPTPLFILEALHAGITSVSQYPSTIGSLELRQAAAQWMKRRFNVDVNAQTQVISSNGSKEAIFHIPQIILNSSSMRHTIVFAEPAYPIYKAGTVFAGGQPYPLSLKSSLDYALDIKDIPQEKIPQIAAIWICYPHNPTGAMLSKSQAQKIYNWALKHNIILLSDECYIDTYFEEEKPPISLLQVAQQNEFKNVLCFFSLSKRSGMTGYRSGVMTGDKRLIELYTKYRFNIGVGTPNFIQKAAIAAWNDDDHVKERNQIFYKKRLLVENFLIRNKMTFLKSQGTFYVWIKVPSQYQSGAEYSERLRQIGLFVTPGESFGEGYDQYIRLALVPTLEKISDALKVWQQKI